MVKILNEYDNEHEAEEDLLKLLVGKKKERALLKDYQQKDSW